MLSLVEMRPTATHTTTNGCRPLSLQPCIVMPSKLTSLLLPSQPIAAAITVCAAAATATATASSPSSVCPPPCAPSKTESTATCTNPSQTQCTGGKSTSVKSSRSHMSLANRRTWHLNGARERVTSLSITLSTSTPSSSVAVRRGMPSPLRVTVNNAHLATSGCGELQSPTNCFDSRTERDEAPELRSASCILPLLYIGSESDASDINKLEALGIGYVLNVTNHLPCYFDGRPSLVYERIPANDCERQDLKRYFRVAIEFIERARRDNVACLVHCVAGVSRSPTIVLAYLMHTHGWSMMEAYNFVKKRRSWIAPNLNFIGQLQDFQHELERTGRLHPQSATQCQLDADSEADESKLPCVTQIAAIGNDSNVIDVEQQTQTDRKETSNPTSETDVKRQDVLVESTAEVESRTASVEPCRSVTRLGEYYTLSPAYAGSLVCGMETE